MNETTKSATLSSRLLMIAASISSASRCHQLETYSTPSSFVSACSKFASSEHDVRVIALLYKHLLNPDERSHPHSLNVRMLLGTCFGTHAIAQMITHLQSMIDRDLVQIEYRVANQHDQILTFTTAGLHANVQLTDRALSLIQQAEAELLAAEQADEPNVKVTVDFSAVESMIVADVSEDEEDEDSFGSSLQDKAIDEMMGKTKLFRQESLPGAFTYIPDESIRVQLENVIAHCKNNTSELLRAYGVKNITMHTKPVKHDRISILLSGASGTGKTAAAYHIAQELNRELYITSSDTLNSPYIAVYERNTRRMLNEFREMSISKDAAPILLIDECESLFAERTASDRTSDRAHNAVIDILLQELERFEGILILTTNTPEVFDAAFRRRIDYTMHLSSTSKETQRAMWKHRLPSAMPGAETVDVDKLVAEFNLTAADIGVIVRNAVQNTINRNPKPHSLTHEIIVSACRDYLSGSTQNKAPMGFV